MVKSTVKEHTDGSMEASTQVTGFIIILKELGSITGQMEDNMKVVGKTINCMDMGFTHGLMGESMKVSMLKIKRKA